MGYKSLAQIPARRNRPVSLYVRLHQFDCGAIHLPMKTLVILSLLFAIPSVMAQVKKCTMPDGRVVYSDTPCPNTVTESKTVIKGPTATTVAPPPPTRRIKFTGSPQTDLIKATALMDNIRLTGRDCEWALKVDKSKMSTCVTFMGKLQPSGEYQQISEHVSELIMDRAVAQQNIGELRTLTRYMQDVVRYKEFMLANLGISGK